MASSVMSDSFDNYYSGVDIKELEFHASIREVVILTLAGFFLYIGSFALLNYLRREHDEEFIPYSLEDVWVYKISLYCCSFSLAVSVGAALLLPISTISNEILVWYPRSWYTRWLNASLIQVGTWLSQCLSCLLVSALSVSYLVDV